jgi:hypothetical protein
MFHHLISHGSIATMVEKDSTWMMGLLMYESNASLSVQLARDLSELYGMKLCEPFCWLRP